MKKVFVAISLIVGSLSTGTLMPFEVQAQSSEVKCPIIVDRQTGKFSKKKAKYRCFKNKSEVIHSGYEKHSFFDASPSSCNPSSAPTPSQTASPTPGDDIDVSGDYNLSGPGERESVVFALTNGGSVTYLFPGGGQFEIKVMNANNGKKVDAVLQTFQASSGVIPLLAQSVPVFIKVEGPGAWTVAINLN